MTQFSEQSPDIAQGVNEEATNGKEGSEQGAGDQGMMFGFATNETPEFMPLPISLSHRITKKLADIRKSGNIGYLRPDGKSQVTVEYQGRKPVRVHTVVLSSQHDEGITHDRIKADMIEKVIKPVCEGWIIPTRYTISIPPEYLSKADRSRIPVSPEERSLWTPTAATDATGEGLFQARIRQRWIEVPLTAARYIAKNIVAAGLADECEVQLRLHDRCSQTGEPESKLRRYP